ncbi:MAG TPA: DUF2914 domain-containing protein, partial [Candidatus Kapabacteria bacterium]|nr:DUF2914 domain-containing protein [Candidatus Kapabacteria bacterium]
MKEHIKNIIRYHQIKAWYQRYERILIPGTLLIGVIFDWFTFTSISIVSTFILLFVYAFLAGVLIAWSSIYDARGLETGKALSYLRFATPLLIQFLFGALLSGSFIFYWFSGALVVSWPFIILIVVLMVGNDVFRHYYLRPVIQMSIYFFILFSLFSIVVPYLFNSLSPWLFVMAGVGSTACIALYMWLLSRVVPGMWEKRIQFFIPIASIVVLMNGFYFLNVIPPIPLSIRDAGVYHMVERQGSEYRLTGEKESWWERFMPGMTIHVTPGDPVYVYTAIFAPSDLNINIVHRWQYYNEKQQAWISVNKLSFSLTGGRREGFRGFSRKTAVQPGKWRVYVETTRGQVLGRLSFQIVHADEEQKTEVIVR